jgi:FAD/FMN-containing dehydrogenase
MPGKLDRAEAVTRSEPLTARRTLLRGVTLAAGGAIAARSFAGGDEPSTAVAGAARDADATSIPRPFQGLLENEGHVYHNWGRSHETRPAVYVEPLSDDDVRAVVADRAQFPGPVSPVGSMLSVTKTLVNDGGTLVCLRKLDAILGLERHGTGCDVVRVQAGCRLKKLHLWLQSRGLEMPFQAEVGEATVGSTAVGDTKDSSLDGPGYFSASVVGLRYVDDRGQLQTLDETTDPQALAEFKCSYGLGGVVVECLVTVRPAMLCRSRFSSAVAETPAWLAARLRQLHADCDALWATVSLDRLAAACDQRFRAGPGAVTPAASLPELDALRRRRCLAIQHGLAPREMGQPKPPPAELVYARADLVNEYWRPEPTESRLDFQFFEHDISGLERVVEESHAFTSRFSEAHGFSPHAWILYFVRRTERARKPFGLYSDGPGVSFSLDPVFSDPVDPRWQRFARDYNQLAIHELGGRGSPIQTQWLTSADLKIPAHLARGRFTTAYYAQFLGERPQP